MAREGWISVKERGRLPRVGVDVLLRVINDPYPDPSCVVGLRVAAYGGEALYWEASDPTERDLTVTHWMPLPSLSVAGEQS